MSKRRPKQSGNKSNKNNNNKKKRPNQSRSSSNKGNKSRGNQRGKQQFNRQPKRGDGSVHLTIKDMANGGYGLAFHNRRAVFVPYTIPGEEIIAQIVRSEKTVDFAEGIQHKSVSGDRVFSECPHFGQGQCWGCQWQHMNYNAQLALKTDVLVEQVQRFGKFSDKDMLKAIQTIVPSSQQWAYNSHVSLMYTPEGFGYARIDGRTMHAIDSCIVLHPVLQGLLDSLDIDFTGMNRLQMWVGSDEATMLILDMNEEDAPELAADFTTSVNIVLPDNEPLNLVGDTVVNYTIGDRNFRMTAGGFFRANIPQVHTLVDTLLSILKLKGHERVLDLYAGVGVFSAFLAPRVELVTMVESYPPMATDADENLSDFENVDVIEGSVESVLESINESDAEYDIAIVDPTGAGMSKEAHNELTTLNVPTIVYIASNPATLGRDALQFIRKGYKLTHLIPFDFAPQTYYVDALAVFRKS